MEIASYRHNPPECQRSDSPSRAFSSATTSSVIPPNHTKNESKSNTQAVDEATQEERPKRIIGDGNIFGHSSTTPYNDRDNRALFKYADNDDDQEIEAALALALPISPITDAVPLRAEASGPVDTQDNINNRSSLRDDIDPFETRLGFRHDREACAAYVLLPPVGSVGLLLLEQRNDYVRFHAWQSGLLFTIIFIFHIFLSLNPFLSWTLLFCDIVFIGWLAFRAHKDAETLHRYKIPLFGPLASSIVDDE